MNQQTFELQEKLVEVKRVSKVVPGGRIFSFTALVVVGDMKDRVGFGHAKAKEVPAAIQKARDNACKNMIHVNKDERYDTVFHPVYYKFGATKIMLQPASSGTGIIASSAVRAVLELAGIKNVLTKIQGSRNAMNATRATYNALCSIASPAQIAQKRGLSIKQVFSGV